MEEYTREQIQRADDTDLYVFLSGRGEQFKRCGKEYRWLRHDSVMINKNEWYRFSQNKGEGRCRQTEGLPHPLAWIGTARKK